MGAWLNCLGVRAQVACASCLSGWDDFEGWRSPCRLYPFAFLGLCALGKWLPRASWLSLPQELNWGSCTGSSFSAGILPAPLKFILSVGKVGRGLRWLWVSPLNGSVLPRVLPSPGSLLPLGSSSPWVPSPPGSLLSLGPSSPWVPPPSGSLLPMGPSSLWVSSSAALPI